MIIICDRDFLCCWSLEAGPVKFAEMFAEVSIVAVCEVLIEDSVKLYVGCVKDLCMEQVVTLQGGVYLL